jgi:oligosaccharide repeat unit polymerase
MSELSLLYFLLVMSFLALVVVPLYQYVKKKRRDLFEPVYLAAFIFLMMFWFRSVYVLVWGSDLMGERPFLPNILRAWNLSWLYLLLAIALFYRFYYSRVGVAVAHAFRPLPGKWSPGRAYVAVWILFGVGLASLLSLMEQFEPLASFLFRKPEVFSTLGTGPLVLLGQCVVLSLQVAYAVLLKRRSLGAWVVFILIALPALTAQAAQGMKGAFLFVFFSLLMLHHYIVRPIRLRFLLLFAAAGILLVFPAFTALRQASDVESYQQQWVYYSDPTLALNIAVQRLSGIEALVFIVRDTPRVMNYQLGKTYLNVLVAWVPREIWPDKPLLGFGQIFTPLYLGHVFAPGGTTYAPTIFGEAYVNFSVAGIILVAVLGGIFLRSFYEFLMIRSRNLSSTLVYAASLPYVLVGLEAHSVAWLTTAWVFLVSVGLSFLLAESKSTPRHRLAIRTIGVER